MIIVDATRILALAFVILASSVTPLPAQATETETLLLQQPTVSNDHVVFVYAQDLWIVGREGGMARRLTSHLGSEICPRFSPDGRWVAFTGSTRATRTST